MAPPSSITIVTSSPTSLPAHTRSGRLLLSPTTPLPQAPKHDLSAKPQIEDEHAFRPRASSTQSRGPCPALNTLSNHGYLPRDGHNISAADFLAALENKETYNLSAPLAKVLVEGGLLLLGKPSPISLYDLARHGRIEHDASMVHKNTKNGDKFAPVRVDTLLLNGLLEDKEHLTLDDIAKRRVLLEKAAPLDALHSEIARGEWALVLDIFGRAHGGKIPTDGLRVWLKENRFPEGWKPTHEQGLDDTMVKSLALHAKMAMYQIRDWWTGDGAQEVPILDKELTEAPEEVEMAREER